MDADSLRIWDNRTFFERHVHEAADFLQRSDQGFHARLKAVVRERAVSREFFTLAHLQEFATEEAEDEDERAKCIFKFLRVVDGVSAPVFHM